MPNNQNKHSHKNTKIDLSLILPKEILYIPKNQLIFVFIKPLRVLYK